MKRNGLKFGKQGGFSLIEMAVVVVVMLVMLGIALNWVKTMARDARNAQESDQLAKEVSLIGKATKAYLVTAPAATYPLNTTVDIPITTLITGGFLPTDFAARMGAGTAAVSPYGQPYMVVARRIVAGEPPTVVVSEANTPMPVKLADVGVEDTDAAILAYKQKVAAAASKDYKAIAATVAKSGRTATGVGNSFTKDLTAYFAGGFAQASTVALVNFKDLEPGGDTSTPGGGLPVAPTYSACRVLQGQLIAGMTNFMNVCSATSGPNGGESGRRIVGSDHIETCSNGTRITVLPFGGTLTSGLDESYLDWNRVQSDCLSDWDDDAGHCRQKVGNTYGKVTMNSVMIDSKLCATYRYQGQVYRVTATQQAGYNVCCNVEPLP